jgi:hypothetical protein
MDSFDTAHDYLYTLYLNITYIGTRKHTHKLSLVSIRIFLPLLGSGFQRQTFSFLWIPKLFPAPDASF